jgi:hypothetical protein
MMNPAPMTGPGMEGDSNRSGADYRNFDTANARQCQAACANEAPCKAWTWVKAGVQGPAARCWLKNQVPAARADACCISGVNTQLPGAAVMSPKVIMSPMAKPLPQESTPGREPLTGQKAVIGSPPLAAPSPGVQPRQRMTGPAISPATLDFGRVWGGDVYHRAVAVSPPPMALLGGRVRVELEPGKLFSISEIRVLGSIAEGTPVDIANRDISPEGKARLAVDRTRVSIRGGTPPFDVALRDGDTLYVTVQAAPVTEQLQSGPFDGSGPYHSTLKLQGKSWQASVPVSANVEGQRLGIVAHLDEPSGPICYPLGYVPGAGDPHSIGMTLSNRQGPMVEGKIELTQLPPGFQVDQSVPARTFKLTSGASNKVSLPVLVDWARVRLPKDGEHRAPATYPGSARITHGDRYAVMPFEITILPSHRMYRFTKEEGLRWAVNLAVYCDGRWNANWHVFNPNLAVRRRYAVEIRWRGARLAGADPIGVVGRASTDSNGYENWSM